MINRNIIQNGYSYIELIFSITIISIICISSIATFEKLRYLAYAKLNFHTIETAFTYAKSLAVLNQSTIKVCGSFNGYKCSDNWQYGILVQDENSTRKFFKLHSSLSNILTLQQSGSSNSQVLVHANTMTYTNGHFTYKSLKASALPTIKLYFNRALRFYQVIN